MRKRILATFLSLLMLLSCITAADIPVQAETGNGAETLSDKEIELGTILNESISTAGVRDTYYFTTTSNDSFYSITAKNVTIGGYGFFAYVYDSYDNFVWAAKDLSEGKSASTNLKLRQNETYRVEFYASNNLTGGYSFLIEEAVDDLPDSRAEATEINLGETVEHSADGTGDKEWFKFTTTDNYAYYRITSKNVSINGYGFFMYLYDYDEQLIVSHEDLKYDNSASSVYKLEPGTTYYMNCYASNGLTGKYSVCVEEITDDTYDDVENAQEIELNTEYTRNMEVAGDKDYFKFTTGDDENYTITLKNMGDTGTYGLHMYLYSKTNEQMSNIYDLKTGSNTSAKVTLKPNTTYYIEFHVSNSVKGFYKFSILDSAGEVTAKNDDMSPIICDTTGVVNPEVAPDTEIKESHIAGGASKDDAEEISVDSITYGDVIAASTEYWYKFTTTSNNSFYEITGKNVSINGYGWFLRLYDENLNLLWKIDDYNINRSASKQIKLDPDSTYYVMCYASNGKLGKYSITVEEIIDDLPDSKAEATQVNLGEDIVYRVDAAGDTEWFTFTTEDCEAFYKIYSKNLSINGYGHFFYVYDGEEEIAAHKDKKLSGTGTTYLKLEPSTTYYVMCTASNSLTGNYMFRIDCIPDDVPDTQEEAMEIQANVQYDRVINAPGDNDYYKIQVDESGEYTFYTKTLQTGGYGFFIYLTDAYGAEIASIKDITTNKTGTKTVNLTADKTYYIKCFLSNSHTGNYRFYLANDEVKDEGFVEIPLETIELSKTELSLKPEETAELTVTYNPEDTTDDKTLVWTSSDEEVATVEDGVVTAVGAGTCTITAETANGVKAECEVTVEEEEPEEIPLESIEISQAELELEVEETAELTVIYNPEDTTDDKTVEWTSSDEDIVIVSRKGKVVAVGVGEATITAKVGTLEAICRVTVEETVVVSPFYDVQDPSEFYYDPVMWAVKHGITNGITGTLFGVDDGCTRAHVVTFLWRALGEPEPTSMNSPFIDVSDSEQYYYKAVLWASESSITAGVSPTKFEPNTICTRAQIVTFLWRAMEKPMPEMVSSPFKDVADEEQYYYDAVLWAVENDITKGVSETKFGVSSPCTRAQIVTFLYRYMAQ